MTSNHCSWPSSIIVSVERICAAVFLASLTGEWRMFKTVCLIWVFVSGAILAHCTANSCFVSLILDSKMFFNFRPAALRDKLGLVSFASSPTSVSKNTGF